MRWCKWPSEFAMKSSTTCHDFRPRRSLVRDELDDLIAEFPALVIGLRCAKGASGPRKGQKSTWLQQLVFTN
jgi:hypothetical protein